MGYNRLISMRIRNWMGSDPVNDNTSVRKPRPTAARRAAMSAQSGRRGKTGYGIKAAKKKPQRASKPRRKPMSENMKTLLWLWFPPVGLTRMWRSGCTWRQGVKIGITAAMAAILLAVFIIPTPTSGRVETGIQMVSGKPEVEVYGPALPALIVTGYTKDTANSIIVDEVANDVHYVYAADDADCYHEYECKFAFASSQRLTVYEAYHLGFKPCGRCNPPVYVPGQTDPVTARPLTDTATETDATAEAPEQAAEAEG